MDRQARAFGQAAGAAESHGASRADFLPDGANAGYSIRVPAVARFCLPASGWLRKERGTLRFAAPFLLVFVLWDSVGHGSRVTGNPYRGCRA